MVRGIVSRWLFLCWGGKKNRMLIRVVGFAFSALTLYTLQQQQPADGAHRIWLPSSCIYLPLLGAELLPRSTLSLFKYLCLYACTLSFSLFWLRSGLITHRHLNSRPRLRFRESSSKNYKFKFFLFFFWEFLDVSCLPNHQTKYF